MKWHYYLATGLYCLLIFWISSQSDPPGPPPLFPQFDKLEHILVFGLLCAMVSVGMRRSGRPHRAWALFWAPVIFTVAFGFTDELHQHFVPKRSVDPYDIVADATGALLMQLFLTRVFFRGKRHSGEA